MSDVTTNFDAETTIVLAQHNHFIRIPTTMECSSITKVVLPENSNIVCEVHSKHIQVGDHNKAFVDTPSFRELSDIVPTTKVLDLGTEFGQRARGFPQKIELDRADIVQLEINDENHKIDLKINTPRNGTLQVGANTELRLYGDNCHSIPNENFHRRRPSYSCKKDCKKRMKPKHKRPAESFQIDNITNPPSQESKLIYKRFFEEVSSCLHPLRDNGEWDTFHDKLNEFRIQYGKDPVWDILLDLEKAQQMCYHFSESNITEAEKILCKILKEFKSSQSPKVDPSIQQLCEGRAYCYLASVHRHADKPRLGKAQQCLDEAEKRLKGTDFLYDKATICYEKASIYLHIMNKHGSFAEEICACLDKCSHLCDEINRHKKWEFVKKGHFAKLKKARLLLNCSTNGERKRKISDEDLEEAKKCLEEIENDNSAINNGVPVSEQLMCLLAKADCALHNSCYNEAKDIFKEGIALANRHGFDDYPARKRLKEVEYVIEKRGIRSSEHPEQCNAVTALRCSSSDEADASA